MFKGCAAFSGDNCTVCSHSYATHVHMRSKWEEVVINEDVFDQGVLAQINNIDSEIEKERAVVQLL